MATQRIRKSNEFDVIRLDIPVEDPADLQDVLDAIGEARIQKIGKPLGIIRTLEELGQKISEEWKVVDQYMLHHMSPTSYYFSNKPKVVPFATEINHVYEADNATPDSPMNEIGDLICFDFMNEEPGSLSRRKFGPNKEIGARLRFYIETADKIQYPVSAKSKERRIMFKSYAHSRKRATLLAKGLDHYFETRKDSLLGLGIQHHHVENISQLKRDTGSGMLYREVMLYIRGEEWFIGKGAPVIKSVKMDWRVDPVGTNRST